MQLDAVAFHCAAKRFGSLAEFGAADVGNRLAGFAAGNVMHHSKARAAMLEKFTEFFKDIFDHRGSLQIKRKKKVDARRGHSGALPKRRRIRRPHAGLWLRHRQSEDYLLKSKTEAMLKNALPEGTILCFDFGLARTGVALGNTLTRSARALEIARTPTNDARWAMVERLLKEWAPVCFVVGVPRHGDGSPNELTARCERFARQLAERYKLPAYTVDERFSSVEVESGREKIDDAAAAVILQQFFLEH